MLTRVLIAINVVVYIWEMVTGDPNSTRSLVADGALYGPYVAAGQWWRTVTGAFLHAGLFHIATNMIALYVVGGNVEFLFGRARMFAIYAIGIAGSSAAVLWFSFDTVTVGASGAIFALFGAQLAAGLRLGKVGRTMAQQTGGIIAFNLILGFTAFAGIVSMSAHIGGLIVGCVIGAVLFMGHRYKVVTEYFASATAPAVAPAPAHPVHPVPPPQHE